jgi:hypothetical protein
MPRWPRKPVPAQAGQPVAGNRGRAARRCRECGGPRLLWTARGRRRGGSRPCAPGGRRHLPGDGSCRRPGPAVLRPPLLGDVEAGEHRPPLSRVGARAAIAQEQDAAVRGALNRGSWRDKRAQPRASSPRKTRSPMRERSRMAEDSERQERRRAVAIRPGTQAVRGGLIRLEQARGWWCQMG